MKTPFITLLCVLCIGAATGQETTNRNSSIFEKKHEVRLGTVKLLAGSIIEGGYEYIIDSNQGVGAYALINLDAGNEWFQNYALTPYYRMYFQSKKDYGAKGFFVEGFTSFFSSDFEIENAFNNIENDDVFDISLGLALGWKLINTAGFVFEFKFGVGRNLLGNADSDVIVLSDFYIGYRF
jgi:hypothetical protein